MFPGSVIVCMLLLTVAEGSAQPSGEEILKKVEANFPGVQDYTVDLDVTADIERMNVPSMHVHMYYKQPDKFQFDSEGFALLPRDGVAFNASRLLSRFSIEEVGEERSQAGKEFKLVLRAKGERAKTTKLQLFIDAENWKPVRIFSSLFDGRSMTATFKYEKHDGHLMPSLLTVQFTAPAADTSDQAPDTDMVPMSRSQMPRNGTITVRYSGYKINTDLSDDIFNKR
jgi:outer membrane lipoprotein-sorting protein